MGTVTRAKPLRAGLHYASLRYAGPILKHLEKKTGRTSLSHLTTLIGAAAHG